MTVRALEASALYHRCDPAQFDFDTTAQLEDVVEALGQDRAFEALQFGIQIPHRGYNVFALGTPGTGKRALIQRLLAQGAAQGPSPSDWCYLHNFTDPHRPRAIALPPGKGRALRDDMAHAIDELRVVIPAAFESDEYRTRTQEVEEELKERKEQAIAEVRRHAQAEGIDLIRTPAGFAFAPIRGNDVLSPEEFEKLPETEQSRISEQVTVLQEELRKVILQAPHWRREAREKMRALNHEVALAAVDHPMSMLRAAYTDFPTILTYLDEMQRNVIDSVDEFRHPEEDGGPMAGLLGPRPTAFRRYEVNVIVDRGTGDGAPVLYEDHPSYQNLLGCVEHVAMMGALVTDFMLIKGGALHRANGGYLVLDAQKVLLQPFAWDALKRALRSGELRIESVERMLSLASTVSLEPEPIPLNVKVVLVGDRLLYYLLCQLDPDFTELFKVAADFEEDLERTPDNHRRFAQVVSTIVRQRCLRHLDRGALARVIEHGSRLLGDTQKLSIHMRSVVDLLQEGDYWAGQSGRAVVGAADVQRAIDSQIRRSDRMRVRLLEQIRRGTVLITTEGEAVGQINGLSVVELGGFAFGMPHRITARVRLGEGEVIDIEREVELGGPIHSKGVLILSGFLGARYAADIPLALSATLVFEQSYGEVEGDSASAAELYALLSALALLPIRQSYAITGSVNQLGEIQAIGGVNEKIEGYFDLCRARGFTGNQGVLIPASDVQHLMLRQDVVDSVAAGQFHIYPITTIDEGMDLLMGLPAGELQADGEFPEDSVNQRVQQRLRELALTRHAFGEQAKGKESGP